MSKVRQYDDDGKEVESSDSSSDSSENSSITKKKNGPVMLHALVDAPVLETASLEAILKFEIAYKKYEREMKSLSNQDVKVTVKPLTECIAVRVLKSICKYELNMGNTGWKTVEDETLREFLFGRRRTLTKSERLG